MTIKAMFLSNKDGVEVRDAQIIIDNIQLLDRKEKE